MNGPHHEINQISIYKDIENLRYSSICWVSILKNQDIDDLLNDLEDLYFDAIEAFQEYIINIEKACLVDFYNFDRCLFSPAIYQSIMLRFWELVGTTRFSAADKPSVRLVRKVNEPNGEITQRHNCSLAMMACIKYAIDDLECIEPGLIEATNPYLNGKNFSQMAEHDTNEIDDILCFLYGYPEGTDPFPELSSKPTESLNPFYEKIKNARNSLSNAIFWATQLETMNFIRYEKSKKAKAIAKKPRKDQTKNLTIELVAKRYKESPDAKWEVVRANLAAEFDVSERTIARRYAEAKEKNLLP